MAEALACACREDAAKRAAAEAELLEKMIQLKAFAEVMQDVP